jgi:SagB-type dehydrogenase family enzyme
MKQPQLLKLLQPTYDRESVWELFHENSKAGKYIPFPHADFISERMEHMLEALAYDQYPLVNLPQSRAVLGVGLDEAISCRVTGRELSPCQLTLEQVGTVLYHAYGVTRRNVGTVFPRPFRTVPSGGALYPLEIYLHSTHIDGLEAGLYHYNPTHHCLRFLQYGDHCRQLSEALIQPNIALDTAMLVFITAVFERSTFKYGDRGYRFVLLEAGHVAQNINLSCVALGLGSVNIGGYADRQMDEILGLDGVSQSTIYLVGIGRPSTMSVHDETR